MDLNNYGVIQRSNSKNKDNALHNRPLTSIQKDQKEFTQYTQTVKSSIQKMTNLVRTTVPSSLNNPIGMKRLPSPQLQSNTMDSKTQKNIQEKYRPPTPVIKSTNFPLNYQKNMIQKIC